MSTVLRCLLAAALAFATLSATADDSEHNLVGRWMLINQAVALQIQFNSDGTYQAWAPTRSFKGKWALMDEDHLATWSGENKP